MKKLLLFACGCLALSAQAASFDCDKANTNVEKIICSDPELSKLDDELSAAYKDALQDKSKAEAVRQSQKKWIKQRNKCTGVRCTKSVYESRLQEFRNVQTDSKLEIKEASKFVAKSDDVFCAKIKRMIHKVESTYKGPHQTFNIYEIDKLYLHGEGTSEEEFHDLDIDADGVGDHVVKSCSASLLEPSDPCDLSVRLSSGFDFNLEGWDMRLLAYQKNIYVILHHDDDAESRLFTKSSNPNGGVIFHPEVAATIKYELYRLDKSGSKLICSGL